MLYVLLNQSLSGKQKVGLITELITFVFIFPTISLCDWLLLHLQL